MAIRPIDMQAMIPKIPEVARVNRLDPQKSALAQQQLQNQGEHDNAVAHQKVSKSPENDKSKNNDDAKNKGKNQYVKKDHNKREQQEKDHHSQGDGPQHKIDIKI